MNDLTIVQDFVVPITGLKELLVYSERNVGVYPIWMCPSIILPAPGGMCKSNRPTGEMYVDIGIYGLTTVDSYSLETTEKELEKLCIQHRGYQFTYADIQLTREEFGQMFDLELYNKVRKECKCEDAFPEIYAKINRAIKSYGFIAS